MDCISERTGVVEVQGKTELVFMQLVHAFFFLSLSLASSRTQTHIIEQFSFVQSHRMNSLTLFIEHQFALHEQFSLVHQTPNHHYSSWFVQCSSER